MGSVGFLLLGAAFMWLANPFFIIGLVLLFRGSKASKYFSFVAVCFSIGFLFFDQVIVNEAGHYYKLVSLKVGYWVWTSSCFLLFIASLIFRKHIEPVDDQF